MVIEILVLSDKNETRSLMLEGWLRYYGKDKVNVVSAGLFAGNPNLVAAKAMMEAVIDITHYKSQKIDDLKCCKFDYVFVLTSGALAYAKTKFPMAKFIHLFVEPPLCDEDEDMVKLKKHRITANELEEIAIEFIHNNVQSIF